MAKRPQRTLSKSILEMKFMQRTKEAFLKQAEDEEGRAAYASQLTEAMKKGGSRTVLEASFAPCEELQCPRRSYHGANPEIERFLELEKLKTVKIDLDLDADVPAEEVARVTYAGIKLEQPPRKKPKFMKPKDD